MLVPLSCPVVRLSPAASSTPGRNGPSSAAPRAWPTCWSRTRASSPAPSPRTYARPDGYFRRLGAIDWLFAAGLLGAALFALYRYGAYMDYYEQAILVLAVPTFAALGWHFKAVRWLMPLVAALSLIAIATYGGK